MGGRASKVLDDAFEHFSDGLGVFDDFFDGFFRDATDDTIAKGAGIECTFFACEYADFAEKAAFAGGADVLIRAIWLLFRKGDKAFEDDI